MPRIEPLETSTLDQPVRSAFHDHVIRYQERITNTKRTLAHSLPAFEAYMQWYPLYQEVETILGVPMAYRFAYVISRSSDCTLCSTFFRKLLTEAGEDPDNDVVTIEQQQLLMFGSCIAKRQGHIADHVYNPVAARYSRKDLVTIIAFAGQMIATNILNNVIETDLDEDLSDFLPRQQSIWGRA